MQTEPRNELDPTDYESWPVILNSLHIAKIFGLSEAGARRMIARRRFGRSARAGRWQVVSKRAVLQAIEGGR